MKHAFYTSMVLVTAAASVLTSCKRSCTKGSGHMVTEQRKMGNFTKLDIAGSYVINLVQDSSFNVSVAVDDNLSKQIITEVKGDKLVIKSEKNICPSGDVKVTIGVKNLEEINEAGAVTTNTQGKLVTGDLKLELAGANKLNLDLNAANVRTDASGSTELNFKGQASSHALTVSGEGKLQAFNFIVGNYELETSGAGDFEINVLHELTVKSSGAADIKYKGNPATINNKKSGVSTLTKVN